MRRTAGCAGSASLAGRAVARGLAPGTATVLSLLGVGAVTAFAGAIVWSKRMNQRDEIDAKRESLIKERDGLAAAVSGLELRSPYRDGTQFVTLGVRF